MNALEIELKELNESMSFAELDAATRNSLKDSQFAYIDPDGGRHLPIHNASHVRNALARLDQVKNMPASAKKSAMAKIKAAAGRMGIKVSAGQPMDPDLDPDESSADTRPASDNDPDESPDDDGDEPEEPSQADDPGLSDVHVPGPLNGPPGGGMPKKKSTLKRLRQLVSGHYKEQPWMTSEQFRQFWQKSIGGTGGSSRIATDAPGVGVDLDNTTEIENHCCGNSCGMCQGAGCGCCDECYVSGIDDNDGDIDDGVKPDAPEAGTYTEGDAHINAGGERFRMFLPLNFAEVGAWIPYLPKPGKFTNAKYGEIEITPERNADFVKKFNSAVYQHQVPLDAEHQTKLSGAMGWIKGLRQNPDGSVDANVDWTPRGRQLMADDAYKFVSPEWYDRWKDPATEEVITNVAIGGALTTRPFFKPSSLRPLVASEQGLLIPGKKPKRFEILTQGVKRMAEELTPEAKRFAELEEQVEKSRKQAKEYKEALAESTKTAEAAAEESKQLSERVAAMETANMRRQFAETARDFPGDLAVHVELMESMDEEKRNKYIGIQKAAAAQIAEGKMFAAIGARVTPSAASADSAVDKARQMVESIRASDPKISEARAFADVWIQNPDLYDEYVAETGN